MRSMVRAAAVVAVVGTVASVAAAAALATAERRGAEAELDRRASLVAAAVAAQTHRYIDTLDTVAAAAGAAPVLTADVFRRTVAPLSRMQLSGATSIVFLVPATDQQVPATQALWRARGAPELTLDPQGHGEHLLSIFSESLDGSARRRTGIDASQAAAATEALNTARGSGQVAVSKPYQLIVDAVLPPDQRQLSFVLTAPVYQNAESGQQFLGWVLMGLRGNDFIAATLSDIAQNLVDVTLDAPSDGGSATVAELRATSTAPRDVHSTTVVAVADRQWRLGVHAVGADLPGVSPALPATVAVAGTLLSLSVAVLVQVLGTGRARAQAQVVTATAGLRQAEAEARRQAALLNAVVDRISDGVGVVDQHGDFLLHNPAAKRMLGIDEDRGGAEPWRAHYGTFTPDSGEPFPASELPLVRALNGESAERVPMLIRNAGNPDGLIVSVSARPLVDASTGLSGAVAVFHDITERTHADRALAKTTAELRAARDALATQRAHLSQVLDVIDVAVLTCDTTGTIVHANRTARAALPGPDRALTVGEYAGTVKLAHPGGTPMPLADVPLNRSLRGRAVEGEEAELTLPDGKRRSVLLHSQPLRNAEGQIIGAAWSCYDVTTLRERETELAAFAGVVAHDLKSPLTAVYGFTEMVRTQLDKIPAAERQRALLDRVLGSTNRMRQLIDDLLNYATARDAAVNLDVIDLSALAQEVANDQLAARLVDQATPPAQLHVDALPPVIGDRAMIRQLLDNLVGNALKYTPPGRPAHVEVTAHAVTHHHVQVTIADRGIGIPAGQHRVIFEGFHRAHANAGYAGTGLGLAICQRIVDRHGGTIFAADNPGGGTQMHFTLPAASPQEAPRPAGAIGHR
jgi:signal transduction histidine kinase/CHASE1-domain containing sensor protein